MTNKEQTGRIRMRLEGGLLRRIMKCFGHGRVRLFRNNVGAAWMGPHVWANGQVIITHPARVKFGLIEGSSDLIGWRSRYITEEDVGKEIAQFVAIEVKAPRGRISKQQERFIAAVVEAGGIGGVARSIDDVNALLLGKVYE